MDSALITVACIDEIAAACGIEPEVATITRRTMNGKQDFHAAVQARVALLEGLSLTVFDEVSL